MYIRSGSRPRASARGRLCVVTGHPRSGVNQESCKALGIESVMVMPPDSGPERFGMFELFGSKPSAFAERDATTLRASTPQVESALRERR